MRHSYCCCGCIDIDTGSGGIDIDINDEGAAYGGRGADRGSDVEGAAKADEEK